jgi:hypothetical protein
MSNVVSQQYHEFKCHNGSCIVEYHNFFGNFELCYIGPRQLSDWSITGGRYWEEWDDDPKLFLNLYTYLGGVGGYKMQVQIYESWDGCEKCQRNECIGNWLRLHYVWNR